MIVDDDKFIHDRLKKMIKWEDIGVRLVCEAEDSDTALELFLSYRPKIVISDIKIPIISGLELAKKILEIDPQVRFIIITGYADFELVRTSVRLGAVDLLSKPILPEEIISSLKKAILYFEDLKTEHISSQNIQSLIKENLPLFQEKFLSYLITQKRDLTDVEIYNKFCAPFFLVVFLYYFLYRRE